MNELLFEYYYDPERKKCCLHCRHYFKSMKQYDAKHVAQVNSVKEPHQFGQKYCIKHKLFVWFIDACGEFSEI